MTADQRKAPSNRFVWTEGDVTIIRDGNPIKLGQADHSVERGSDSTTEKMSKEAPRSRAKK